MIDQGEALSHKEGNGLERRCELEVLKMATLEFSSKIADSYEVYLKDHLAAEYVSYIHKFASYN